MTFIPRPAPLLAPLLAFVSVLPAPAGVQELRPGATETHTFRQWIAGQEAGGSVRTTTRGPEGVRFESREWIRLERMGVSIVQNLVQTALKRPDGSIQFTYSLALSREPMEGQASWSPAEPGKLRITPRNLPPRTVDIPLDLVLWPGDEEDRLKAAARDRSPVHIRGYNLPTQQISEMDLKPLGPGPLPGFPRAVRFQGKALEGGLAEDMEIWICPEQGDVRQEGSFSGIPLLTQRSELPPPADKPAQAGFFERTLKTLPPHPFLPWLPDVEVRWTGRDEQNLPEDPCQRRTGVNRYRLTQAALPSGPERTDPPVKGTPPAGDAPFLASTPLVQFTDPVFEGLIRRLDAPPGASRWDLARRVNAFVYDWIRDKNYTVGFASAQEVARNATGDCTEHGVLAVALLRRLGVPARGVVGWVAMEETMGLHFWVEVRLGQRWFPMDPTFDMVPASAFRIKLGTTDLADLGSVGWENAAATFQEGSWAPGAYGPSALEIQGDTVHAPGLALRCAGATWKYARGVLELDGRHRVKAAQRPTADLKARLLQGRNGLQGLFAQNNLWVDCGGGRWLQVENLRESEAFALLDRFEARTETGRRPR